MGAASPSGVIDLAPFCGTDIRRPYLHQPWSRGEWTYATDGHIMVRIPRLADIAENQNVTAGEKLFACAGDQPLRPLPEFILSEPQMDACDRCNGRGTLHDCPDCDCKCEVCDGSGEIAEETSVSIFGAVFDAKYAQLLVALQNCRIADAHAHDLAPVKFSFDGGEGLLMQLSLKYGNHIEAEKNMKTLLLTTAAIVALSTAAHAAPLTAAALLSTFGDIVDGNFATTSEAVGPVLIGANLAGNGILDTGNSSVGIAGLAQVNVFGSNSGTWAEGAGQTVYVGGTNTGAFLSAGAGSQTSGHTFPYSFATDIWAPLQAYSAALAAMPATGTFDPATTTFSGAPGSVFNLTTAELAAAHGIVAGLVPGDVVNVTGPSWSEGFNYGGFPDGVVWNFVDATSLTFDEFQGTVIAPDAAVTNTAPIEGDLAAASYIGRGELHFNPPPVDPLPMSEPSQTGFAMIGAALVAWRFGRRKAEAA